MSGLIINPYSEGAIPPVNSTFFDGTTNYMYRSTAFVGAPSLTRQGIFSAWIERDSDPIRKRLPILSTPAEVPYTSFLLDSLGFFNIILLPVGTGMGSSSSISAWNASVSIDASSGWNHIACSWRFIGNDGSTNKTDWKHHLYLNGDNRENQFITAGSAAFNMGQQVPFSVATDDLSDVAVRFTGCLSEIYFNATEYLDLSIPSNLQKLRTASGHPAYLGSNGQNVTGTIPLVYIKNPFDSFYINSGSGGNFDNVKGTLQPCFNSPSN
jgi:hypothetical protein